MAISSSGSFLQVCARHGLQWDRIPDIQIRNGLLRSSSSFAFYSHSNIGCWFRIHFCSLHTDDLIELIHDNPEEFVSPWPFKDVLEAFLESERKHTTIAVSQYDLQEGCHLLLRIESSFMAMSWEQKSPAPASWPRTTLGARWQLYKGFTKQYRVLVCVLSKGDSDLAAVFAIFFDIGARRAMLLPADLTDSALIFATQCDLDPYHEYSKRQGITFTENADNKVETFPPKQAPSDSLPTPARSLISFSFDGLRIVDTPPAQISDSKPTFRESQRLSETLAAPPQATLDQPSHKNQRLCSWCQTDMTESNVHLCGLCNNTVYCSRDCLYLDFNRGLHPAICRGVDRSVLQTLPAPLKIYRQMLGELGPQARRMVKIIG